MFKQLLAKRSNQRRNEARRKNRRMFFETMEERKMFNATPFATYEASHDAHVSNVSGSEADTNFGDNTGLIVRDDYDFDKVSYVSFSVAGLFEGETPTQLTLTPTLVMSSDVTVRVRLVQDSKDAIDESTLTWNNRPVQFGTQQITLSGDQLSVGQPLQIDVAELLEGAGATTDTNGQVTFAIDYLGSEGGNNWTIFASSEHSNAAYRPQLETDWIEPVLASTIETHQATDDAFVRSGGYANSNYGSSGALIVKDESATGSYHRKSYLSFQVDGLLDTQAPQTLVVTPVTVFADVANVTVRVRLVTDSEDAINENTLTWNTQPTIGTEEITFSGSELVAHQALEVDVTELFAGMASSSDTNDRVTFVIDHIDNQGGNDVVNIASSEISNVAYRPQLRTSRISETPFKTYEATDDAMVLGHGITNNLNYGNDAVFSVSPYSTAFGTVERRSFVSFSGEGFAAGAAPTTLVLTPSSVASGASNVTYRVRLVGDGADAIDESTITWNNQPSLGSQAVTFAGSELTVGQPLEINISELTDGVADTNGQVTFAIDQIGTQQATVSFHSSESGTASYRPQLNTDWIGTNLDEANTDTVTKTYESNHDGEVIDHHLFDDENYGHDVWLTAEHSSTMDRKSYVSFDVNGPHSEVTPTTLALTPRYVSSTAAGVTFRVRLVSDGSDAIDEGTLTWNNQPSNFGAQEVTFSGSQLTVDQPFVIDISSLTDGVANTNDRVTFVIEQIGSVNAKIQFHSSEVATAAYRPQLTAEVTLDYYASDDAFVRGGQYADDNYGNSGTLTTKMQDGSYVRESYLSFEVDDLFTSRVPSSLILTPTSTWGASDNATFRVRTVHDSGDDFSESLLTWNNRPEVRSREVTFTMADVTIGQPINIDVSSLFADMSENFDMNGRVAFAIDVVNNMDDHLNFASSEHSNPAYRPRLLVDEVSAEVVDSTLVLDGTVANDDFVVTHDGAEYTVYSHGVEIGSFADSSVNDIVFYGYDGDDVFDAFTYVGGQSHDVPVSITAYGHHGNDQITTGSGDDFLFGGSGDDVLDGKTGHDVIFGGFGDDTIGSDDGENWLYGEAGDDIIDGGTGIDRIWGGAGDDTIYGYEQADVIDGGDGADTIYGGNADDTIYGGSGNDIIEGEAGADTIHGDDGQDNLYGGTGNDTIFGGADADYITGNDDHDTLHGGSGDDDIFGGSGNDTIYGNGGEDDLYGNNGIDTIYGGLDSDDIFGGANNDFLYGDAGHDKIYGGTGNDELYGGADLDELYGEEHDDLLVDGSYGEPTAMFGGTGVDTYVDGSNTSVTGKLNFVWDSALDIGFNPNKWTFSFTQETIAELDLALDSISNWTIEMLNEFDSCVGNILYNSSLTAGGSTFTSISLWYNAARTGIIRQL